MKLQFIERGMQGRRGGRHGAFVTIGALSLLFAAPLWSHAAIEGFSDDFNAGAAAWNAANQDPGDSIGVAGTLPNLWIEMKIQQSFYGNIYRFGGADGVVSVQADINNVSDTGATWGPSLALYYDNSNWVQFTLRSGDGGPLGTWVEDSVGGGPFPAISTTTFSTNTWYTLKIQLDRVANQLKFYIGPQGGALTQVADLTQSLPTSFDGNGYMILGKGFDGANPFLRNSCCGGPQGTSLYDNAIFTVVPEPTAAMLLTLGGLLVLRRRTQRT